MLQRLITVTKKSGVFLKVNNLEGEALQKATLKKLLSTAQHTAFGKVNQFGNMLDSDQLVEDYKYAFPVGDYARMLPWWTRCRLGEEDVTWPGRIDRYAVSSGTSDGSSKFIPVSRQMVRAIRRASMRQVLSISQTDVPKDHMAKGWLMVGGSTELEDHGHYYSGDLSGIITGKVPMPFSRMSKPDPFIRREKDWQQKIEQITKGAPNWDIGMVAGVPAWVKLLIENILETYGAEHIHEIWPHFQVYVHGGVSLAPYKNSLDQLMGQPVKYFETYLASEGFIAFQSRQENNDGLRLLLRNGIYFEFIPFNRNNFTESGELKDNYTILSLSEVNEQDEYALILSTCAGAWKYLIGDTIRFTDLSRCEIKITGRTKHFLSLCGEHLSVDNMQNAMSIVSSEFHVDFEEFTVCGIPHEGFFAHEWFIACDDDNVQDKAAEVKAKLDMTLKVLNDDYRTERYAALKDIFVHLIPRQTFLDWMEKRGKVGSQSKFPRVLKGEVMDDWREFVKERR